MSTGDSTVTEKLVVRLLERDNIGQVVPIYLEAFNDTSEPDDATLWFTCNLAAYPQKLCFGVWRNDLLLGYIVWTERGGFRSEAVWELEQIAVLAGYRNQRIGTTLILDSLEHIRAHTARRKATLKLVMVTTGVSNRASRLYQKALGAVKEAVVRDLYSEDEQIMVARFNPSKIAAVDSSRELFELEYEQCNQGYNNRDQVIPQEISYIGVTLGVFISALLITIRFLDTYSMLFWIAYATIALAGVLFISGFLVDVLANTSVRKSLRMRSIKIEVLLSPTSKIEDDTPLQIWRETISKRKKIWIERLLKSLVFIKVIEKDADYFTWSGILALVVWIAFLVLVGIYAPEVAALATLSGG